MMKHGDGKLSHLRSRSPNDLSTIANLDDFAHGLSLTSEEKKRFASYDQCLSAWSQHTNLIAKSSFEDRWQRHFVDSVQLWPLIPAEVTSVLDMGSGAGFPGLVLAILSVERAPARHFTLVDSVGKKARFLREAAESADLTNVTSVAKRVEMFHVEQARYDLISARAMTALPKLLDLAVPLLKPGGMLIFPKGERAQEELTAASERWRFNLQQHQSATHPKASILVITEPKAIP